MTTISNADRLIEKFPLHHMANDQKDHLVRQRLCLCYMSDATSLAKAIEDIIGPDSDRYFVNARDFVRVGFKTRKGEVVTLYGGWIHASNCITWDVLCDAGEYDDDRFQDGLQCLSTVDMIRALRIL